MAPRDPRLLSGGRLDPAHHRDDGRAHRAQGAARRPRLRPDGRGTARMTDVEELVETLLYEGYALYPYTPGATKNATPTPFGIVYPPAYAAGSGATFDVLQIQCLTDGDAVSGEVHFLQATGVRHEGAARRVELPAAGVVQEFDFDGLRGIASISLEDGRMTIRVENL